MSIVKIYHSLQVQLLGFSKEILIETFFYFLITNALFFGTRIHEIGNWLV